MTAVVWGTEGAELAGLPSDRLSTGKCGPLPFDSLAEQENAGQGCRRNDLEPVFPSAGTWTSSLPSGMSFLVRWQNIAIEGETQLSIAGIRRRYDVMWYLRARSYEGSGLLWLAPIGHSITAVCSRAGFLVPSPQGLGEKRQESGSGTGQ